MSEQKNRMYRYADYYAKNMGLRVFPCNGKTPITPHGCKDATADPAQIAEWWGGGSTYNVAIATGTGLSVKPPDYSDAGNADVFSHVYRDDLIYTDALGWLWWNGKRWERDDHKATAWALELSEKMLQEAKEENRAALLQVAEATAKHEETGAAEDADALEKVKADAARAKAYLTHAKNSRNAVRIKNMLELSKPGLVIKADKLDANPFDLNTPAGIVDLTSGQIGRASCRERV